LDQSLLLNCFNHEFFNGISEKLRPDLFDDTVKEVFNTIVSAHEKFEQDLTPTELMAFWMSINPTSTDAWTSEIKSQIDAIATAPQISAAVAADVISSLWRQSVGLDIANLGIRMSEGDTNAMDELSTMLLKIEGGYEPDDYPELITNDLEELLALKSNNNRFRFNIPTLARHVYGIGRGEFCVIAAYTNTGKTAFTMSIAAGPDGFCEQGAKVLYLANEESAHTTKLRAHQIASGMTRDEIEFDFRHAAVAYAPIKDLMMMQNTPDWDMQKIDGYIRKLAPDILIVDMADKVVLRSKHDSGHERLRELYYRLRELSKKYNIAVIGVSQASKEAEGRTVLTMSMLEGSKVGKASEADLMLGIGRKIAGATDDDDGDRWITIMKNKISGIHTTVQCKFNVGNQRYEV
jgi:KaiC/GvpD/RAD55 family RecA-like ATPase